MALPTKKIPELTAYGVPLAGTEQLEIWAIASRRITSRDFVLPAIDPLVMAVNMSSTHPASRVLTAGAGVVLTDNGAGSTLVISATSTGAVAGNPTGLIGMTAVNGTAITWTRSDATHAIDPAIIPTWTGQHTFTQPILGPAGTALLPSHSFSGDPNSGLYNVSADVLGLSVGGGIVARIDAQMRLLDGSAAAPSLSFINESDIGLYRIGSNSVGVGIAGVAVLSIGSAGLDIVGSVSASGRVESAGASAIFRLFETDASVNEKLWDIRAEADDLFIQGRDDAGLNPVNYLQMTRTGTAAGLAVWTNTQHRFSAGSAGTPSLSFSTDTDTGIYSVAANQLGFSVGGALRFSASSTLFDVITDSMFENPVTLSDASITRLLHETTDALLDEKIWELRSNNAGQFFGFTRTDVDGVGATWLQVDRTGTVVDSIALSATVISTSGVQRIADGTAGSPAIGFISDTDTGLYRVAAGNLGFTTDGVLRFALSTTVAQFQAGIQVQVSDGSAAAPAYSFSGDTDSGLFRIGANDIRLVSGAATTLVSLATGVNALGVDGSVGAPAFTFLADTDTGLYRIGANRFAVSIGAVRVLEFGNSAANPTIVYGGSSSLNNGFVVNNAADTLNLFVVRGDGQIQVQDGAAATPSLSFVNDTDTGVFSSAANQLGLSAGGVARLAISTTAITSTLPNLGAAGSAAAPNWSFTGDPDTGVFNNGANQLGLAAGGTLMLALTSTQILPNAAAVILAGAGSAAAPVYSFGGDPNTGVYNIGADQLGISTGGTLRLTTSTTAFTGTLPWLGQNGTVGAPALSFSGDTDTGIYNIGANSLGISAGGTLIGTFSAALGAIDTALLRANGIHNGTAPTGAANQYIASGTYTPTASGTVNLDAITPLACQWMRVGNVATVSGEVTVDPTSVALTQFELSLPVASDFTLQNQLAGTAGVNYGPPANMLPIRGSVANNTALFQWTTTGTSSTNCWFHFTYVVV